VPALPVAGLMECGVADYGLGRERGHCVAVDGAVLRRLPSSG
jgi:hypothetical protein